MVFGTLLRVLAILCDALSTLAEQVLLELRGALAAVRVELLLLFLVQVFPSAKLLLQVTHWACGVLNVVQSRAFKFVTVLSVGLSIAVLLFELSLKQV